MCVTVMAVSHVRSQTDRRRIHAEFSGHMRDGLLYTVRGAEMDGQGVVRDAEMMEAAMAGMGTKDERM